ncbi:MAG: hypothetical protein R2790_02720 [Flavobacterium haoranii]
MKNTVFFFLLVGMFFLTSCNGDDDNTTTNPSTCDLTAQIIAESNFDAIETSNVFLTIVTLNGNCLEVTLGSSGCDPNNWEMNLYGIPDFDPVVPVQRDVKVELINNEICLAIFEKTVSFDLTPFQVVGQNEVVLNIEGWSEPIVYEY